MLYFAPTIDDASNCKIVTSGDLEIYLLPILENIETQSLNNIVACSNVAYILTYEGF